MIPVSLSEQLFPQTIEFTLKEIIDHQLELSGGSAMS
jgi:hypothetical protein